MRKVVIAAASTLALLSGPVIAQTSAPSSGASPSTAPLGGMSGPAASMPKPAQNPLTDEDVSKIKGTNVYGSDGKKIGDVSTALMKPGARPSTGLSSLRAGCLASAAIRLPCR
jgi:hypothetical protein